MEVDKKRVGQRIKSIRQSKGMTMEEFGKLFGATKGNVSLWEKGSSIPSNERLPLIAKIGDLTVNELLYGNIKEYLISFFQNPTEDELTENQFGILYELYTKRFGNTYQSEEVIHDFIMYARDNLDSEHETTNERKIVAIGIYLNIILLEFLNKTLSENTTTSDQQHALKASLNSIKYSFEMVVRPFEFNKSSKDDIKSKIIDTLDGMNEKYDNKLKFNEVLFDSFFEV